MRVNSIPIKKVIVDRLGLPILFQVLIKKTLICLLINKDKIDQLKQLA